MKIGDTLEIEYIPFKVVRMGRGETVLRRLPRLTAHQFNKGLRARRWRTLVSSNFFVDVKTGNTVKDHYLLSIGIPSKRIERLHRTLPILGDGPVSKVQQESLLESI